MKRKPSKPLPSKPVATTIKKSWPERLEAWMERNKKPLLFACILLSVLLGLLQFNYRISEANDDSMYLEDAFKFSKNFFGYYTANAPFYPMFLSLIIRIFGFKLLLLKLTGFLFMTVHLFFFFKAFEKRVHYVPLFFVMFFTAVNPYMLYYASMTFTEQFFMMQQAIFLYLFFRAYDKTEQSVSVIEKMKIWLPVGLILFILTMSRNVAVGILIPVCAFLLIEKKYKDIAFFLVAFALFRAPFEIIRKLLWGDTNQFSNQMNSLIKWKDPYDPSKGFEDFSGYIDRFTGNFNLYINKRFLQILGFLNENDYHTKPGFGFILILLTVLALFIAFKKRQNILKFVFLYAGSLILITFIAVQTRWDQLRLILVFIPLVLLFLTGTACVIKRQSFSFQFLSISIMLLLLSSTLFSSLKRTVNNLPILKQNLKGDIYYGYTPDWVNYLRISTWCADSLDANSLVACRKAPMSFIYGKGKTFYPVYQVFSTNPDSIISQFKKDKVTHILLASLRRNPRNPDGYIINTLHRLVQPVISKYPNALELVKTEGVTESAYVYKINYDHLN